MENKVEEPMASYNTPLSFEQVWLMFQETDKKFQDTDKKFQDTDKKFQDTDKKFQDTDRKIKELSALFTTQWGKLVESLVEGDLLKLLKERGIEVERIIPRMKGNKSGQNFEFDLIAINDTKMVIVEVKTTLRPQDVTDFHEKLWKAKTYMPEYKDKIIFGAVAFITSEGSSDRMAENQGFYVIKATGNSSSIVNSDDFEPKQF